ncbi:MAG: hypothetical protein ACI8PT_003084 [Gammaproteobacteria bacterium]
MKLQRIACFTGNQIAMACLIQNRLIQNRLIQKVLGQCRLCPPSWMSPHSKRRLNDVRLELAQCASCIRSLSALELRPLIVSPLAASIDSTNTGRSERGEVIVPMNSRF